MRDYISELSSLAVESRPGVALGAVAAWEQRTGRVLPDELRRFYETFNGGRFQGDVEVYALDALPLSPGAPEVVLGRRGQDTELVMLSKERLVGHGGIPPPSWLLPLSDDTWVFAVRQGQAPLRPARTFEGVLDRVLPPRETETFGDATFARGMTAVQEALAALPGEGGQEGIQVIRARPAEHTPPGAKPAAKKMAKKVAKAAKKRPAARRASAKARGKKAAPKRKAAAKAKARKVTKRVTRKPLKAKKKAAASKRKRR
jgi:hypothetical protein